MPVDKYHHRDSARSLSKQKLTRNIQGKKIDMEEIPFATVRMTVHALKWVFLLVFIYLLVSMTLLLWQGGTESVTQILAYGITGFVTFFMGYFGWEFARSVTKIIKGNEVREDDF